MSIVPKNKPMRSQADVLAFLSKKGVDTSKLCLLAVRGYYRDSMGKKGVNDRRVFDDSCFVVSPTVFASFNFNTDPNGYRKGYGFSEGTKGMACLKEGIWLYQKGLHKGVQAFTQAQKFTVVRDGNPDYEHSGYFGINLHSASNTSTSSLGCQTVPAKQWPTFKSLVYNQMDFYKQKTFQYILVHESETGWNK